MWCVYTNKQLIGDVGAGSIVTAGSDRWSYKLHKELTGKVAGMQIEEGKSNGKKKIICLHK